MDSCTLAVKRQLAHIPVTGLMDQLGGAAIVRRRVHASLEVWGSATKLPYVSVGN